MTDEWYFCSCMSKSTRDEIRFQRDLPPEGYGDFDMEPQLPCETCIGMAADRKDQPCSDCVLSYETGGTHWEHYKDKSKPFVLGVDYVRRW